MKTYLSRSLVTLIVLTLSLMLFVSPETFAQAPVPSGIVAWYAGDGDARDISGNGNNGTLQGGASFVVGKAGQGFAFDGSGEVDVPNAASLNPTAQISLEGWVYPTTDSIAGNTMAIIANKEVSGTVQYEIARRLSSGGCPSGGGIPVGNFAVAIGGLTGLPDDCGGWINGGASLPLNAWSHIALTYDGANLRAYVNGNLTRTVAATGAIPTSTGVFRLGKRLVNSESWVGRLDEISLYNRALSLAEIQSIFNAGVNGKTKQAATNAGANSQTQVGDATITFANVSAAGTTTDYTIDPLTVGLLPVGYLQTGLAYDISTTAAYSGTAQVCFNLPALVIPKGINAVRIFHRENGLLLDRTSSTNAATNTVCASVATLSQFVIATESIKQGQIIYSRTAASASVDGTIWAINPNGSDDHQVTTGSFPRLSPDGNYLAFKRKHSATTDPNNNYGLWLMNVATGAEREIFYQGDFLVGFDFTPDSAKIVLDWQCSIFQMNLDGSNRLTLDSNCFDDAPVPQPSTGLLAYHGANGVLYTSNPNGSNRQPIPNAGTDNYYPSWSKDGQFLAYFHYDGSSPDLYSRDSIYKIKPDGTGKVLLKTLTGTDRFSLTGAWSADGTKIYMPARIGGVTGIYEVATDGSGTISRAQQFGRVRASGRDTGGSGVNSLAPDAPNLIAPGSTVDYVGGVNGFAPVAVRAAFDFDGDAKADLAAWNPSTHNWFLRESLTNTTRTQSDWGNGALGDIAVPRDYDGDGKCDIAVFRPSEGNWYIIQSQSNTIRLVNWGVSGDRPVPADFDGDGRTDIAVWRPTEGNWYIINSATNTVTVKGWGASADIPVPGFYDADNRADIAVWRGSEGNWYILNSLTNTGRVVSWGGAGDRPVLADFDGDGRTDIAVFRSADRGWYIRLSGGGIIIKHWGETTDKLVPADYDGDGRADVAVFRPSEGNWYIINSAMNTLRLENLLQATDDVPAPSTFIPQ